MKSKKILAITGIRSEYDILYPILKEFEKVDFEVCVAVCNAHLSDIHNNTYQKVIEDGFKIADKIDCLFSTERLVQRSKGVGLLIMGLSQTIEREQPDFLLVVGDREESIATCIAGNYMNILTIHVGGGDPAYGNTDDPIRFACSKIAHIHCTTTEQYKQNLIAQGEEEWRILNSGNPSYVNISHYTKEQDCKCLKELNIMPQNYIVLLKHPLSSEVGEIAEQMKIAIESCANFAQEHNLQVIGIYPNTDPGSFAIHEQIKLAEQKYLNVRFFKTLPRKTFITLISNTLALVGNSSMGILEAPFYKIPVVNIGNRQKGRLNAGNVNFVDYSQEKIISALKQACFDKTYRTEIKNLKNPYGDETSCKKIVDFVKKIDLKDKKWYIKTKLC